MESTPPSLHPQNPTAISSDGSHTSTSLAQSPIQHPPPLEEPRPARINPNSQSEHNGEAMQDNILLPQTVVDCSNIKDHGSGSAETLISQATWAPHTDQTLDRVASVKRSLEQTMNSSPSSLESIHHLASSSEPHDADENWDMAIEGRHPPKIQNSFYTRFFGLEKPDAKASVIVQSPCVSTGWLLAIRGFLFVYTFIVLLADLILTDRPQYTFCYLTQLSYLGLIAYLGTVSWHTLSQWRREQRQQQHQTQQQQQQQQRNTGGLQQTPTAHLDSLHLESAGLPSVEITDRTTIERQYWLLTDMNFFLYHTICTFHVIVPLLYWGYQGIEGEARMMAIDIPPAALWRNYSLHGGDFIVMTIEFLINAMPFIPTHFVIVLIVCLLYLAEAHLVYRVDGFWIYPFLDTKSGPIWVAMYLGVGAVILAIFTAVYYLHRFRNWLRTRKARRAARDTGSSVEEGAIEGSQDSGFESSNVTTPINTSQFIDTVDGDTKYGPDSKGSSVVFRPFQALLSHYPNRKRSDSEGSEVSTASTLVGQEEAKGKGA